MDSYNANLFYYFKLFYDRLLWWEFYDRLFTLEIWYFSVIHSFIELIWYFDIFRLSDDRIYDRERDRSIGVSNNYDRDGPYVKRNSIGGYLDDNDRDTYSSNRNSRSRDTRPGYNRNVLNSSGYQDGLDR